MVERSQVKFFLLSFLLDTQKSNREEEVKFYISFLGDNTTLPSVTGVRIKIFLPQIHTARHVSLSETPSTSTQKNAASNSSTKRPLKPVNYRTQHGPGGRVVIKTHRLQYSSIILSNRHLLWSVHWIQRAINRPGKSYGTKNISAHSLMFSMEKNSTYHQSHIVYL